MAIKKHLLIVVLISTIILASCADTQVQRIVNTTPVPFNTYAFDTTSLVGASDVSAQLVEFDNDLRLALGEFMQARGYRLSKDTKRADMILDYSVLITEEQSISEQASSGWEAQFDSNAIVGEAPLPVSMITKQVVLFVSLGPKGGPALWGGKATKNITRPEEQAERKRMVSNAVSELLNNLPPAP